MRLIRWFLAGAVIALILVLAIVVWIDRAASVQVVVSTIPAREIRVHVEGAVATPGVVALPGDARLVDAVDAAGGFAGDADFASLNLAGRVGDGERVIIPDTSAALANPLATTKSAPEPGSAVVNLNTATADELVALPGIGPVLAGRIVEYRERQGQFVTVDELSSVTGISARLVDELRPLVTVDDGG